ncbi:uncharacterized protein B0T15DRAFT_519887 [Chaetomium strumarium]|uniref:Uncharacterized protein n=1 Tax=Chaetomium strumarium TaxID=1170767 RepID=A0AAJ0H342_9PEZI|nr:hypothetical protein B0T15DRAFT_519887 [Chaetomium strumarium]
MGPKRNHSALAADDNEDPSSRSSSKRRREQQGSKPRQGEGKPDPTYGQRVAFPGLDDDEPAQVTDDDLEFEENGDALAYLRAVRQEASSVPHVLVAPRAGPQLPPHLQSSEDIDRSIYDNGVGDSRGYYHDGAYTAMPSDSASVSSSEEEEAAEEGEEVDPADPDRIAARSAALRKAYFASLTSQFLALRRLLHRDPPPRLVASLSRDHGTEVGSFGAKSSTFRIWTWRIRYTDPLPVQVAALDRQSVLKLLRVILGGKFIRRGYELRERTSRWIWALLARLPDRGEMDYAEVGWVRELGKRAVLMMVSIAQMEALREEVDGDLGGAVEGEGDDEDEEGGYVGEVVVDEGDEGKCVAAPQEHDNGKDETAGDVTESKIVNPNVNAVQDDENGELDMDIDDGEVSDDEGATNAGNKDVGADDLAAAKSRLLARLQDAQDIKPEEPADAAEADADEHQRSGDGEEPATMFDEIRSRVNMRATLNMILTVAGEFYGQRDLLEFRDPFPAL